MWSDWPVFCEYGFTVSALWCPLATPTVLGFSYLRRGVSHHSCSSKVQPLLLTLDEGYLLTAAPPDLEHGTYFPGGSDGKASAYSAGDLGSIPGSGRSPREVNGNPLQYSCPQEYWSPKKRGSKKYHFITTTKVRFYITKLFLQPPNNVINGNLFSSVWRYLLIGK